MSRSSHDEVRYKDILKKNFFIYFSILIQYLETYKENFMGLSHFSGDVLNDEEA